MLDSNWLVFLLCLVFCLNLFVCVLIVVICNVKPLVYSGYETNNFHFISKT